MAHDFRGRAFSSRTCKAYAVAIPGRPELATYRLRTAFFVPEPLMAAANSGQTENAHARGPAILCSLSNVGLERLHA
jgi:hypothetical protein